jgi:hypothetical protein
MDKDKDNWAIDFGDEHSLPLWKQLRSIRGRFEAGHGRSVKDISITEVEGTMEDMAALGSVGRVSVDEYRRLPVEEMKQIWQDLQWWASYLDEIIDRQQEGGETE